MIRSRLGLLPNAVLAALPADVLAIVLDVFRVMFRSRAALLAENLFLRRQLALYKERKTRRSRPTPGGKLALVILSRFFCWRNAIAIVKPDTFIRWHRAGFRLLWRDRSRGPGRPALPQHLRMLIVNMARENVTWGHERIADELSLKLGLRGDSRTIAKYLKQNKRPRKPSGQRWTTFIQNQAAEIVACDLFTAVTATFQILYVFVALEIGSRRLLHGNVTSHPTAEWTRQQFREFLDGDTGHRYLIHDHDSRFSAEVDEAVRDFGLTVLKTPVHSPMANAHCERVIGTIRRECLDYLIPLNEPHLRRIFRSYFSFYNRSRPHSALGPGIPEPAASTIPASRDRHALPRGYSAQKAPILGGLHHDYRLTAAA